MTGSGLCLAFDVRRHDTIDEYRCEERRDRGAVRQSKEGGYEPNLTLSGSASTTGSWPELGRLAEPEDADHFLRTIDGDPPAPHRVAREPRRGTQ
ncbi:hypothetical protein [Streptomyces sp. NPDC054804]